MAFTYKGVTPKNITYKGSSVKTLTYKGTTVWKATTPFSFTYTGTYETEGDLEGNFIIRFKTSGTLTMYKNLSLSGSHTIVIGEGGTAAGSSVTEVSGKPSKFDSYSVNGGVGRYTNNYSVEGCDGGSGGGYGGYYDGSNGGSDGSNGGGSYSYGKGQGTTTREFGEATGKLYAGGGGAGKGEYGTTGGYGGAGGGGNGFTTISGNHVDATPGEPNTGGGGGGGCNGLRWPGNGGSGIVCLRNAR